MDAAAGSGVLAHLSRLESRVSSSSAEPSPAEKLRDKVQELTARRDQLRAEIQTHQKLLKLRLSAGAEEEEEEDEDSQLLRLMVRHTELKDLLQAHHLTGGYDALKTRNGRGLCVSVATAYEGVSLDTYNLEVELKPRVRIVRHNVPPFVPLSRLAEQSDLQADLGAFLSALSRHLNAFAGRRQQLKLVKELHTSAEVMESNALCSLLVLMLSVPRSETVVLCTLEYSDHCSCLPTRVHFDCEEKQLPDSAEWKKNGSLLMDTPVHKALDTMKKMGSIV
ncbi:centromere protein O [Cololabis saira]|uniref:centromere protein O n=1 Tax=Cololabis saira TaxID=129043 RepID=UPI002AD580ED|nr:centromere protein O [Cololabis saira]